MKIKHLFHVILIVAVALTLSALTACKTPKLEAGGVYAPTNETGVVIYNDLGLALADASYKFAYEAAIGVFEFEKSNRAKIKALSPDIGLSVKHELDKARVNVLLIDQRWAVARKAYKANPTPAGLSTVKSILSEIQRLIPVIQSQLEPVNTITAQP